MGGSWKERYFEVHTAMYPFVGWRNTRAPRDSKGPAGRSPACIGSKQGVFSRKPIFCWLPCANRLSVPI